MPKCKISIDKICQVDDIEVADTCNRIHQGVYQGRYMEGGECPGTESLAGTSKICRCRLLDFRVSAPLSRLGKRTTAFLLETRDSKQEPTVRLREE